MTTTIIFFKRELVETGRSDWRANDGKEREVTERQEITRDEALSILTATKLFPNDYIIDLEENGGVMCCGKVVLLAHRNEEGKE